MFFGKHFSSMYSGSMVGAGAIVFAVMGYVIACQKPDKKVGSQVDINPKLLAAILGEDQEEVERAVAYLCSPDPDSTTKKADGRRLIKIGQFSYQVVNGAKYLAIRDEEMRRAQNREAQRRKRAKEHPLPGEAAYVQGVKDGTLGEDGQPLKHGENCNKFEHDPEGSGYLHDERDDTPYEVDGMSYCGRCHRALT